ncbi:MAG: MogA/MoaB family molybdenum cofactor biosynthesis protein [Candidatus Heimdallarchaeota archaeon]|nr:MogA/MoaB family molybdenum cofactor biosynthesis protein [Candidatus Heimdallarchaeota archaeon]
MPWKPHDAQDLETVKTSLVIVSDSLFAGTTSYSEDKSSTVALEEFNENGIYSINLDYYPDDFAALRSKIDDDVTNGYDLIVLCGGTGIGLRDISIEALRSKVTKELPGFGEEFRRLSIEEIGALGMLSRCTAGIYKQSMIVALPGSPNAVKTGINLLCKIVGHTLNLLHGD